MGEKWTKAVRDALSRALATLAGAIGDFNTEIMQKQPRFAAPLGRVIFHITRALEEIEKAKESLDDFEKDYADWEAEQRQGKIPGTEKEAKPGEKKAEKKGEKKGSGKDAAAGG